MKSAVFKGLAVIGTIWIAFHIVPLIAVPVKSYWLPEKASAEFPSPDGRFKALVFLSMGGGPATSYCGTKIRVAPAASSFGQLNDEVYSGSCGGLNEGHWAQNLTWTSPNSLEIAFDPTNGARDGLRIANSAIGGEVHIHFAFRAGGKSF